jgi:hypothetical protein
VKCSVGMRAKFIPKSSEQIADFDVAQIWSRHLSIMLHKFGAYLCTVSQIGLQIYSDINWILVHFIVFRFEHFSKKYYFVEQLLSVRVICGVSSYQNVN